DVAWAGFPLLWRRGVDDQGYLLDVFLGRPILSTGHLPMLGEDVWSCVELADRVNQATRGGAAWRSLDEVARHAYLQRQRPDGDWEALMTSNEACLHNPDPAPRSVVVHRPSTPPGMVLMVDGERVAAPATVTVRPGGTAVVRLVVAGVSPALGGRNRCSIFPTSSEVGIAVSS